MIACKSVCFRGPSSIIACRQPSDAGRGSPGRPPQRECLSSSSIASARYLVNAQRVSWGLEPRGWELGRAGREGGSVLPATPIFWNEARKEVKAPEGKERWEWRGERGERGV